MAGRRGRDTHSGSGSARLAQLHRARIDGWIKLVRTVPGSRIQDKFFIGMESYLYSVLQEATTQGVDNEVISFLRKAKNNLSSAVGLIENRPPRFYKYVDVAAEALEWALKYDG